MSGPRTSRAFTLTELMVAVVILIVVIVATSKMFGTASRVTGVGQAGAAVLQEAAAIERQMRSDFERLSREGVFIIRCVAVPNDVHVTLGGPLLNPALPPTAFIRADQLLFFAHGAQTIQTLGGAAGSDRKGQGAVSRIYCGAAFQLPEADAVRIPGDYVEAQDPRVQTGDPLLVPWYRGPHPVVRTVFQDDPGGPMTEYSTQDDGSIDATQPPASRWLLARHAVVLVDDGGDYPHSYLEQLRGGNTRTARWIDHAVILGGRVDAAASELNDIRFDVLPDADLDGLTDTTWHEQRSAIAGYLFYPRAERVAPGTHRVDQALTNQVIAGACGSFIVDWTYERGLGTATNADGETFRGFWDPWSFPAIDQGQPWFGLDEAADPTIGRGVQTYDDHWNDLAASDRPETILPVNIEPAAGGLMTPSAADLEATGPGIVVYEAVFGYNQDRPLAPDGQPWVADPANEYVAYTPWPSAIRITMVLHDSDTKLEAGRAIQFVIDLPQGD
ncbi:MAG: prepilin-type N-terminal cleavage/methylation domain-containing protein [Planctomycetota bacterium]